MPTVPGTQPLLSESALHLVRRFTYGYNTRLAANVLEYPDATAWFDDQLNPGPDPTADATLDWWPRLRDSPTTTFTNSRRKDSDPERYNVWNYGQDFASYSLARRITAQNQVHEMMVDFWSNLLHIPVSEDSSFAWRMDYDLNAIRPNALTSYRDLLNAAVTHPAMTGWLSNDRNAKGKINENLGRELLELFTVGRAAKYSEDDVKNSAKLLTGFTLKDGAAGYDPQRHDNTPAVVMSKTFSNAAADGRAELRAYLDWLAMRPETAQRIAERMCTRFVSDDPDDTIVTAVRVTYLESGSDIKACLHTLIAHPAFLGSKLKKARTPIEDVIAADRACDIVPTGAGKDSRMGTLNWFCSWTGQAPFSWPRPDGFPEKSDTYLSPARLLRSWTMHSWTASIQSDAAKAATDAAKVKASRPLARWVMPPVWPITLENLIHHQSVMLTGSRAPADTVAAAVMVVGQPADYEFGGKDKWGNPRNWEKKLDARSWIITLIRSVILNAPEAMLR